MAWHGRNGHSIDTIRGAEGGGLSDSEFAAGMGVRSRETIRQYREKGLILHGLRICGVTGILRGRVWMRGVSEEHIPCDT